MENWCQEQSQPPNLCRSGHLFGWRDSDQSWLTPCRDRHILKEHNYHIMANCSCFMCEYREHCVKRDVQQTLSQHSEKRWMEEIVRQIARTRQRISTIAFVACSSWQGLSAPTSQDLKAVANNLGFNVQCQGLSRSMWKWLPVPSSAAARWYWVHVCEPTRTWTAMIYGVQYTVVMTVVLFSGSLRCVFAVSSSGPSHLRCAFSLQSMCILTSTSACFFLHPWLEDKERFKIIVLLHLTTTKMFPKQIKKTRGTAPHTLHTTQHNTSQHIPLCTHLLASIGTSWFSIIARDDKEMKIEHALVSGREVKCIVIFCDAHQRHN